MLKRVFVRSRRRLAVTLLVAQTVGVSGCFSSLDQQHWSEALYRQPSTTGTTRTFNADVEHTIAAISVALTEARFDQRLDCDPKPFKHFPDCVSMNIVRVDDSTSIIYATKTEHGFDSGWLGTQARLIVRSQGQQHTSVTVVSMYRERRLLGRLDYAPAFFGTMDRELNQPRGAR